jgi:hypothetical protein
MACSPTGWMFPPNASPRLFIGRNWWCGYQNIFWCNIHSHEHIEKGLEVKRGANGSSPSAVVLKNSVGKDSNISSGFQAHGIYNRIDIVARKIRYTLDEVEQYDKWLCRVHKYSATAGINRPCTEKFAVVLRDMRRGTDDSHPSSLSFISQVAQKTFFNGRLCFRSWRL